MSPANAPATTPGPNGCATGLIKQVAIPLAVVTPLHIWMLPPEPSVKVTVRLATGFAGLPSSSNSADIVAVPPFAMTVSPV